MMSFKEFTSRSATRRPNSVDLVFPDSMTLKRFGIRKSASGVLVAEYRSDEANVSVIVPSSY